MSGVYLLSTVVSPTFGSGRLEITGLDLDTALECLSQVTDNLCGHPVTNAVLKDVVPELPEPKREFWRGDGIAYAARPKGGVRGAGQAGDTQVTLDDLEFCMIEYHPGVV